VIDGANRNDVALLEPTLDAISDAGLLADIGTLHLDRGDDAGAVRDRLRAHGIDQFEIQRRGTNVPGFKKRPGCGSGCDGSSKRPTRGGRTTASCAATPTGELGTARPLARPMEPRLSANPLRF